MAFRLKTFVRVLDESAHDSDCVATSEDGRSVTIKDVHQRFQPTSFSFPRVFTHRDSQVVSR